MELYVNGEKIGKKVIDQEIKRLRPEYKKLIAEGKDDFDETELHQWSRENVIERVLLKQAARKHTPDVDAKDIDAEYDEAVKHCGSEEQLLKKLGVSEDKKAGIKKDIADHIRNRKLLEMIAGSVKPPSDDQMEKFYNDNIDNFKTPPMIRASHIVRQPASQADTESCLKQMEEIKDELKAGADFAEIANKYSQCPEESGDLGFFPRGQMVQEFEDVVFNLSTGQISEVFKTQFGYHIAMVTDKKPEALRTFEDSKEIIEDRLTTLLAQKALEDFIDKLKAKAKIEEK